MSESVVAGEVFAITKRKSVKRFCVRNQTPEEQRHWAMVYSLFICDFFFEANCLTSKELDDMVILRWITQIKGRYQRQGTMPLGELRAVCYARSITLTVGSTAVVEPFHYNQGTRGPFSPRILRTRYNQRPSKKSNASGVVTQR
jgi:hypothetical protein